MVSGILSSTVKLSANRWAALMATAGIPRILAAFFLPNTFGDAYVYIRDIGAMSTKLRTGTFAFTDFYGFWLPLYQFLAALLNVFVGNGFYSGKLVSAIFGIGVCVFVYAITEQLTKHRTAALLAFLLIALNPIHILTSSSALTDVPHGFFVLASLYFVLKRKWLVAAIFAALAGLTRVESWMFVAAIPLIQFLWERRVSIPAVLIMLVPPLLWFYVSWKAAGDWLACFKGRQEYHDWLLQQNPALAHFSFFGVLKDGAIFINSIDIAVTAAAFIAGWIVLRRMFSRNSIRDGWGSILAPVVFFFAFFALLTIAYLTHQQPIIFPRYGLILFSLGIPMLAWTYLKLSRGRKLLTAIIIVCGLGASAQLVGAVGLLKQISAQRAAADYLRNHFDSNSDARIFCDEGTVTVMSGIPAEKFLTSADAPKDRDGFLTFLKARNVEWLVVVKKDDSTPAKQFPASEYGERLGVYESVMERQVGFLPINIHLYRVTRGLSR
jgi:hypothetical protein